MKPLLCSKFNPDLNKRWKEDRTRISELWFGGNPCFLWFDFIITVVFAVCSTVGIFGILGEDIKWFGILNLWRVGGSLILANTLSALVIDRDQVPLTTEPSRLTRSVFNFLWLITHLGIMAALFVESTRTGAEMLVGMLFLSKWINLMHTTEFDLYDAIKFVFTLKKG